MKLYQRILGDPFVYDRIRPLVVGGSDWSPLYRNLAVEPSDVILDVGCGAYPQPITPLERMMMMNSWKVAKIGVRARLRGKRGVVASRALI